MPVQPPAASYVEDDDVREDDHGWPHPARRTRPVSAYAARPTGRRRRSFLDYAWIAFAVFGLAAAAGAALWYLSLRGAPPSVLTVPRVVGTKMNAAVRTVRERGFGVRVVEQPGPAHVNVVFSQRPAAGTRLDRGATVTLRVANGRQP